MSSPSSCTCETCLRISPSRFASAWKVLMEINGGTSVRPRLRIARFAPSTRRPGKTRRLKSPSSTSASSRFDNVLTIRRRRVFDDRGTAAANSTVRMTTTAIMEVDTQIQRLMCFITDHRAWLMPASRIRIEVMLNQMTSATGPQFHLDRERSEQDKQRRERHFHVVEVPLLRAIGFSMITLLVLLRYSVVPDRSATDLARPWLVGAIGMIYSL